MPINIPPQNTPISEENSRLFSKTWFLVWQAIANAINPLLKVGTFTQATLPTLGMSDAGFIAKVSDYGHVLLWSGTSWGWAPGDEGSGKMQLFEVDPTGVGWHLYDGSTVSYLKADGTLGTVTLPNLAGTAAYTKAGSPNSGPNAAIAPTVTNPANTGTPTPNVTQTESGDVSIPQGTGAAIAAAGTGHTHGLNNHTHTIGAPTVGTNGEPINLVRRPWFRQ